MSDGPFETTVRVGEITDAEPFPEARTEELVKLWIDLGDGASAAPADGRNDADALVQSAAQLGFNYDVEELPGRQVLCATDLGEVAIGEFTSEVLTVGVPDADGNPVLVAPDEDVPLGGALY